MLWIAVLLGSLLCACSTPLEGAGVQLFTPDRTNTLLVQGARSGRWGWTKGHRESTDTSWLETAIREVREESGFELGRDYILCNSVPEQWGKRLYWQGIMRDKQPDPKHNANEHGGIGWFPIHSLEGTRTTYDVVEWLTSSRKIECDFD